ncbi:MAG: hypothetical protein IJL77_06525 [Clostridia bacterium]|nr:hypothetical protein [Clostridia bacterium]
MKISTTANKNRIIKSISALTAVLLICLSFASCGRSNSGVRITRNVSARNVISRPSSDASLHFSSDRSRFVKSGISSGFIELWADERTCSFGIYDSAADSLFTALPSKPETANLPSIDSSMVSLRIAGGTDIYLLNSQDNSVAYGKSSVKTQDNSCIFTYDIFPSPDVASKKSFSAGDIGFRVTMTVKLADGSMTVNCKWENLTGNLSASVESMEILNYFGAYNTSEAGDFLFVPDGCGAVINTSVFDESFESLSFTVYGDDHSCPGGYSGSAAIPAFGIKTGQTAFAALIEDGDAAAVIKAEKAVSASGFNRVYSSFNITPSAFEDGVFYLSDKSNITQIDMCYRFLSGINATYSGMASAVREQLIRDGMLSSQAPGETDSLPFFLTLTGVGKESIGSFEYQSVLTDFEQAQDMLVRMKNKGIDSVNVRYCAAKTGGTDSRDITYSRFSSRLGGRRGLASLYEYISNQNMRLFIDIDILSASGNMRGRPASDIFGNDTLYTPVNTAVSASGADPSARILRQVSRLKNAVAAVLSRSSDGSYSGICLNDAGSLLYSDFSKGGMLRQEASRTVSGTVSPLSTGNEIMTVGGSFYMLKNIKSVTELPLTTTVSKSGSYTPVPFIPLILHGLADYSGAPLNESPDPSEMMLRFIEYGACPCYKWNYKAASGNGESDIYYYDNSINAAAEFYAEANACLYDLRHARMTDHYKVSDGVYCTEYDTGAMIYVNYTDRDFSVRGNVVEAGQFLRVN